MHQRTPASSPFLKHQILIPKSTLVLGHYIDTIPELPGGKHWYIHIVNKSDFSVGVSNSQFVVTVQAAIGSFLLGGSGDMPPPPRKILKIRVS